MGEETKCNLSSIKATLSSRNDFVCCFILSNRLIVIFFLLFRKNVWALCPSGYYLSGINTSGEKHLYQIEHAKCCRPQNHPNAYEDCYNENVWGSFDKKGWSECKRDGYYMTGFYKSNCEKLYCIEEFRCCKMKSGNFILFGELHSGNIKNHICLS